MLFDSAVVTELIKTNVNRRALIFIVVLSNEKVNHKNKLINTRLVLKATKINDLRISAVLAKPNFPDAFNHHWATPKPHNGANVVITVSIAE